MDNIFLPVTGILVLGPTPDLNQPDTAAENRFFSPEISDNTVTLTTGHEPDDGVLRD